MENWKVRTLIVTGPFSDGEFAEVVELMRNIDARHSAGVFAVIMDDPGFTLSDAHQAVVNALPKQPGRVTEITEIHLKPPGSPGSPGNEGC